MSFRLVPKSVTLNDLEWRNGPYFALFLPNLVISGAYCHLVPWPSNDIHGKFYGDSPRGTPPLGGLNARGVANYSDFSPLESCISETVQDRR